MRQFFDKMLQISTASLFAIAMACVTLAFAHAGSTSTTTKARADGGKSETTTNRRGTECKIFSRSGQFLCARTFGITNHAKAIQKCLKMKC